MDRLVLKKEDGEFVLFSKTISTILTIHQMKPGRLKKLIFDLCKIG